jgi:hypothetical protein
VTTDETGDDDRRNDLASRILGFLVRYPQAVDNAEGVARFWLADIGPRSAAEVRGALDLLLERGWVERRSNRDGTTLYSASSALRERVGRNRPPSG